MRVYLAATHLTQHEPPSTVRYQGSHPLKSTGFQQVLEEARVKVRRMRETECSSARHKTWSKIRHTLIKERIKASTVTRNTTRRAEIKSIARVPLGSTLVSVIREQAKRRKEITDLFGSDSEKRAASPVMEKDGEERHEGRCEQQQLSFEKAP